jgi:hypothetical protein
MNSTTKVIIVGATGVAMLAAGAFPALAANATSTAAHTEHGLGGFMGNRHFGSTNGRAVGGTITSILGSTLTIQPKAWPKATTTPALVTVNTASTTKIMKDGKTATLADLATGEMAIVVGTKETDGSILATRLMVRTSTSTPPGKKLGHFKDKENDNDADDQ